MRLQQSEMAKLSEYLPKLVFFNFSMLSTSHPLPSSPPGVLPGLTPSTRYIITVSACSPVGCTESLHNDNGDDNDMRSSLRTPEEGKAVRQKHTYLHMYAAVNGTPVFLCPSPVTLIYDFLHLDTHRHTFKHTQELYPVCSVMETFSAQEERRRKGGERREDKSA